MLTFDRHPAEVVRPESAPKLLTTLEQKLELIARPARRRVVVLTFDEARSKEPAEEFVPRCSSTGRRALVVVGADFHFGYRRHGDVALLERMGAELGFEVLGLGLVARPRATPRDRPPYSSTRDPAAARPRATSRAHRLLGRPHEVRGTVERGDRRGRELGFPTANVAVPPTDPASRRRRLRRHLHRRGPGWSDRAISLGRRPTFYEDADASCSRRTCSTSTATSTGSR